jgi:hypothetical protein
MNSKAIVAVIAIGISFAAAITPLFINLESVSAQCTSPENPAGNVPPGQIRCEGSIENPAGNSPPGRNK